MEQTKEKNPLVKWSQKTEVVIALKETEDTHLKQLFLLRELTEEYVISLRNGSLEKVKRIGLTNYEKHLKL